MLFGICHLQAAPQPEDFRALQNDDLGIELAPELAAGYRPMASISRLSVA